jgi:hypothetical protein
MAFRGYLKQSTGVTKTIYMESNANPRVGVTGLAAGITKYISKAGGASASATMTTSEIDSTNMTGVYAITFTAGQTDTLGELSLKAVGAGANHVNDTWEVVAYLPGSDVTIQNGTASNQLNITSGNVTLASGTHTGAVIPTVTTLTDLTVTANAEPVSVPASTASIASKISWLFMLAKNKITQSPTTTTVLANDSATTVSTSTVSDSGTTFTRGKFS